MKINKKHVGKRIRELRQQKNISMDALSKEIKVASKSTVNSWERGQSIPRKDTLVKLANFFNVDINFLKYGTLENYTVNLIKEELNSENSKLYPVVEEFLIYYDKKYVDFQNGALFFDDNGKIIPSERYSSIIYTETIDEFIGIFSSKLYLQFKQYAGNILHYDNDQNIINSLFNFLITQIGYYSETFIGKCNRIKKAISENIPSATGYSNKSIEEIEKEINNLPNTHTAIDLKYSSKLHDLQMDFLEKLNTIEDEYNNLRNTENNH